MKEAFHKISNKVSNATGTPAAFLLALAVIVIWVVTGPMFAFSDTWQLVINTGTTIVTFLMVFLIQNTQNRDSKAMHLKIDELIRVTRARDSFVDLEDLTDDELEMLADEFKKLHESQSSFVNLKKIHEKLLKAHSMRSEGRMQKAVNATTQAVSSILNSNNSK